MRTRIMIILAIIGLALIWFGGSQENKMISLIGIILIIVGIIGGYFSAKNKKGMGFLRRL